jgi:hypothetical protein
MKFLSCRSRSQWPRSLKRRSLTPRLLIFGLKSHRGAWVFFRYDCCVLSMRGHCEGLITNTEESYRMWCLVVCNLKSSWMRMPEPNGGCRAKKKGNKNNLLGNNLHSTVGQSWHSRKANAFTSHWKLLDHSQLIFCVLYIFYIRCMYI